MSETPTILGADGRPAQRPAPKPSPFTCPMCGAGKDRRVSTAGFGPDPMICCGACGHHFEGAKE